VHVCSWGVYPFFRMQQTTSKPCPSYPATTQLPPQLPPSYHRAHLDSMNLPLNLSPKPSRPLGSDAVAAKVRVGERRARREHRRQPPRPLGSDAVAAKVQVGERRALREHRRQPPHPLGIAAGERARAAAQQMRLCGRRAVVQAYRAGRCGPCRCFADGLT